MNSKKTIKIKYVDFWDDQSIEEARRRNTRHINYVVKAGTQQTGMIRRLINRIKTHN